MNIKADILFKDVVADADLEEIERRLQCCANEWFYPEVTPTMPEVHASIVSPPTLPAPPSVEPLVPLEPLVRFNIPDQSRLPSVTRPARLGRGDRLPKSKPKQPALDKLPRPIFVVSDLHLGDRGPRDNFAHMNGGNRTDEFWNFLNMVERANGRLIIVGDLFELWQSNMSLVLTSWHLLLNRLARMKAVYILGNHDADLLYFCSSSLGLSHPFFKTMATNRTEYRGGKSFHFIHGHETDSYCAGSVPGIGRITAIYTGLKEDRNGGPLLDKYRTVEDATTSRLEWVSGILRWCLRKPNRRQLGYLGLCKLLRTYNVVVSGHTHRAGQLRSQYGPVPAYNAGTWAEGTCSFVVIDPKGKVGVYDWIDGQGRPNATQLKVKV